MLLEAGGQDKRYRVAEPSSGDWQQVNARETHLASSRPESVLVDEPLSGVDGYDRPIPEGHVLDAHRVRTLELRPPRVRFGIVAQ